MSLRHVMILASAGSGKTYALTNRFVALLAGGAAPERIVALTFTRKAAAEFFDEILGKLARAASDAHTAAQLAREIGRPALGAGDFLRLLRTMVDAMPRLRLGTLDGFFGRIVRAFPFELGLAGDFEVVQEHAALVERRRLLRRMFASGAGGLDEAQREFIEAFKRATFGAEEKQLASRLDGFLDEHLETFLAAPAADVWGNPARIWPDGCEWLAADGTKLGDHIATLRALLARRDFSDKQVARFEVFFKALPLWSAGAPLPPAIEYLLKNVLAGWDDVRRGSAEITVERKKMGFGAEECRALSSIVRHIMGDEFARRLEITRGIHAVLRSYDALYHDSVRREGRLTFGDVQRLLLPQADGVVLGRAGQGDGDGRLMVDFRLDAQFDHWLLDEFQDTSFGQWSVLRNLVDEAVQDPTGARSFFCVGDVKQAIYRWREGDPELFHEILDHYNEAAPGTIAEEHLVASWRSGPAIIECVNAVFGRGDVLTELFPGKASEDWNRDWRTHESARPKLNGQAAWLHAEDEEGRFGLVVSLLQEIAPLERGLECAVLTQTNGTAAALADYLRREGGIPAVAEADLHIATDNPLGAALLALVQAAAHPGDRFAHEHLAMTPLRALLDEAGLHSAEQLSRRVLGQIHADGFERTLEFWLERLDSKLAADDSFSRERGRQLLVAAALFDASGGREVGEFLAFMQRHAVRDSDVTGVVKVLTIHKAKGLGFDVVLLPDLEGQRIDQRRQGLAVQRTREREVQWVLDLPSKIFFSHDATLAAHVQAAETEAAHEALALLYVAMSRAKRAMYLITSSPSSSVSHNYRMLLARSLGGCATDITIGQLSCAGTWASGDGLWHRKLEPSPASPPLQRSVVAANLTGGVPAPRRPARRPSSDRTGKVAARQILADEADAGRSFGEQVHGLLAEIEWREDADTAPWGSRGLSAEAVDEARACITATPLEEVWARRPGVEVWRERMFEIVLDGAWIAGAFDRVLLKRGTDGRVVSASVFDFKTVRWVGADGMAAAVSRHRAQMNLYRRVVAVLAGVEPAAVACQLVFTHERRLAVVPWP
ncbi:MAG: UvrD-helicase domain-containing protein [Opitutaceae bacterium]